MEPRINCLTFNDTQDFFACGTNAGLRIYNTDPLIERINLDSKLVGEVIAVHFLQKSNLIAFVSRRTAHIHGKQVNNNRVCIWDDAKNKLVVEIDFASSVVNVKLSQTKLVAVTAKRITVFSLPGNPVKIADFDTRNNPKGICGLSTRPSTDILAFPSQNLGGVHTVDMRFINSSCSVAPSSITAHQNEIACMALSSDGKLLATASTKGTLIRLFDVEKKVSVTEVRRGTDPAYIHCLNFSLDSAYLCVSSDKGTIHIFGVRDLSLNKKSLFQNIGIFSIGSYTESQWSLAKCAGLAEKVCICGFGENSSIFAIYMDGSYYKFTFTKDGTSHRDVYERLLSITDDQSFWDSYK